MLGGLEYDAKRGERHFDISTKNERSARFLRSVLRKNYTFRPTSMGGYFPLWAVVKSGSVLGDVLNVSAPCIRTLGSAGVLLLHRVAFHF